jgi:DNA-binding XRE family transcriptional regulator
VGDQQVGALFRAVRIKGRKRQADVARAAGVARWSVSAIERGHFDAVAIGQLRSIASALEIRVELDASWRGGDGARIVNERHSRMHELVAARLVAAPGWEFATEVTFSEYGERGVIDILAWHAATRTLLVIELKTEIPDPAGLVAQVDRYRRLAAKVGRDRGWVASSVAVWVLVAESDFNRDQLARHSVMLRNAFPLDGHFLRRWLRDPAIGADVGAAPTGGRSGAPTGAGAGVPGRARVGRPAGAGRVAVPGAPTGAGAGVPGRARVAGLSFLAIVAGGSSNGRLGPTKRIRRPRSADEGREDAAGSAR